MLEYDLVKHLPRFSIREILPLKTEEELINSVKFFERDVFSEIFADLTNKSQCYLNCYPGDMKTFLRYLVGIVINTHTQEDRERLEAVYDELYILNKGSRDFSDEIRKAYVYLDDWLAAKLKEVREQRTKPIDEARKYIDLNYAKQLSLSSVAEAVHLSSNYFCKLFKNETGIGFADYILNVRLRKSQEMLLRTDLSIKIIAEKVGYSDDKYFSRLFKRQVGIKPSEYRKLYMGRRK